MVKRANAFYPYKSVSASVGNNISAIIKLLRSVEAVQVMTNHDEPAVAFQINNRPFVIKQPIDFFLSQNGDDFEKARKQGWSALRDYVKALVTRSQVALNPWTVFASHFQLPGSTVTTIEEQVVVEIENGNIKMLATKLENG